MVKGPLMMPEERSSSDPRFKPTAIRSVTTTIFCIHGREFTKFLGGGGRRPWSPQTPGPQKSLTQLRAQVRGPRPAPPHAKTPRGAPAAGPGRRPDVQGRGHSPSAFPRPPASCQGPLQRSPHLTGKQQLPEQEDARPERRLRLPQRRAPFSERKCLEAGQGSPTLGAAGGPQPPRLHRLSSTSRCEAVRGGYYGGAPRGKARLRRTAPPQFELP